MAAAADPRYPAEIALVLSNRPEAPGIEKARRCGLAVEIVDHALYAAREPFEMAMTSALESARVDIVALAGFMRLLSGVFIDRWHDRVINIHPSLLPLFPGLDTHARALRAGVKLHGCSVHFVRREMDSGPIIGQAAVPVLANDTVATLADRVLAAEHRLYPHCLKLLAEGRVHIVDNVAVVESGERDASLLVNPDPFGPLGLAVTRSPG